MQRFLSSTNRLEKWLAATLLAGLTGTEIELLLLGHYDGGWQIVPLVLIPIALATLAWHRAQRSPSSVRALQTTMTLFLATSVAGLVFHFRGAAAFQLEMNAAMPAGELIARAMRAKDPPVLAPGVMLQLGLIGLAYTFCSASPLADPDVHPRKGKR
jgi:hypothetical protein